jgi:DNA-binding MarR family transcriptional regulator
VTASREPADRPSSSLAVRLRQAELALREELLPTLAEQDLTLEHWRIIAVVDEHPGIAMGAVANAAVVTAASLTRHVDRLVERGIVVRHVDPDDRRRAVLALAPRAQALAARLRDAEQRARGRLADDQTVLDVTTPA